MVEKMKRFVIYKEFGDKKGVLKERLSERDIIMLKSMVAECDWKDAFRLYNKLKRVLK